MLALKEESYKDKKVITIGTVSEITGLSERQIRYYEERKLIFPGAYAERYKKVLLQRYRAVDGNCGENGGRRADVRNSKRDAAKGKKQLNEKTVREQMIRGQLNAQFGIQKPR
ncbi:MerR family transcriptional regulator TnrA [Ectobacillus funiculus]